MYVIGYRGNIPTKFCYLGGIEINEQQSVRNPLNALCYQSNCMNWVFSPELTSVCLGTGHKMANNSRC